MCRTLGSDEVIDYKTTDVVARLREGCKVFHHVFDNVGNVLADLYPASKDFLVDDATYFIISGGISYDYIKVGGKN